MIFQNKIAMIKCASHDFSLLVFIALAVAIALGVILIFTSVFMYVRHKVSGVAVSIMVPFGCLLVGLSIFSSFQFSIDKDGFSFQATEKELIGNIAESSAESGNKIQGLENKINDLTAELYKINKLAKISLYDEQKKLEKESIFNENSKFSALVFYKSNQDLANKITNKLLTLGFKSSATSTDLKEAGWQAPQNTVWIIYTDKGKEKIDIIKKDLGEFEKNFKFEYSNQSYPIVRGDIEVLLF